MNEIEICKMKETLLRYLSSGISRVHRTAEGMWYVKEKTRRDRLLPMWTVIAISDDDMKELLESEAVQLYLWL